MMFSCHVLGSILSGLSRPTLCKGSRKPQVAVTCVVLAAFFCTLAETAAAQSKPATNTSLAITSGGNAVNSVAAGSVVSLTAQVKAAGATVTPGQVNFCDASAKTCTDIHLLGTAQLTATGKATLKLRPGIGTHSYKAVFLGTTTYAGSSSGASALTVTGLHATTTAISLGGYAGNYTLTATVAGIGNLSNLAAPTGKVSFTDTSNGNAVLANAEVSAQWREAPDASWGRRACARHSLRRRIHRGPHGDRLLHPNRQLKKASRAEVPLSRKLANLKRPSRAALVLVFDMAATRPCGSHSIVGE